jgi:hypothetical protein
MIPKGCKRLAGVDFPIAGVSRRTTPEARRVPAGRQGRPVVHTTLIRSDAGFPWRNYSREGGS